MLTLRESADEEKREANWQNSWLRIRREGSRMSEFDPWCVHHWFPLIAAGRRRTGCKVGEKRGKVAPQNVPLLSSMFRMSPLIVSFFFFVRLVPQLYVPCTLARAIYIEIEIINPITLSCQAWNRTTRSRTTKQRQKKRESKSIDRESPF